MWGPDVPLAIIEHVPIRPELRKYYGPKWRRYRKILLEVAGHRCARCRNPHSHLNGAHVNNDPRDGQLVAVWCPSCHSRHDTPHRVAMTRRTRARRSGQLWLSSEIEWAPYPSWMIPRHVLDERQFEMFEMFEFE